jgi:hypothetical protein
LAAGADAIVVSHPPDTESWRAVREAHARLHPGVPVCIELSPDAGRALSDEITVPGGHDAVGFVENVARDHRDARDGATTA